MGLKTAIQNAVKSGFTALGESSKDGLQVSITYSQITSNGTYDPSTGAKSGLVSSDTIFDAIQYDININELDGKKVLVGDQKVIFPSDRISFTPSFDDYITIGSQKWSIIMFTQDPAGATWELLVRRS